MVTSNELKFLIGVLMFVAAIAKKEWVLKVEPDQKSATIGWSWVYAFAGYLLIF